MVGRKLIVDGEVVYQDDKGKPFTQQEIDAIEARWIASVRGLAKAEHYEPCFALADVVK